MKTPAKKPSRLVTEQEVHQVEFDNRSLKDLKDDIETLIDRYGESAVVKETCHPHDNYSFSVFIQKLESDDAYKKRVSKEIAAREKKRKSIEKRIAAAQRELANLK